MTKIKDICNLLDSYAPPALQESYDNATLITGNPKDEVNAILLTLDATEEIVDEAIETGCNLIVAHHPIVFKGLKSFTGKNYVERTIIKAIQNNIAIYACHTNLDNVHTGVNKKICDVLGLVNTKILAPKSGTLKKLTVFVPKENTETLLQALYKAGAGQLGNYKNCSFRTEGMGVFEPNEAATPYKGEKNKVEQVLENRVEVLLPTYAEGNVLNAMFQNHPYEEVAYYLQSLDNKNQEIGSGMVGELKEAIPTEAFFNHLKSAMNLITFKHTKPTSATIKKVAVCGGAGSFLLRNAISKNADIFISSDFKYHEFFDAENKIIIADIGHYESEVFTKDLFSEIISKKFTNIAVRLSKANTNPIVYS